MEDYKVTWVHQSEDATYFALFAYCDPITFESVVNEVKWKKVIDAEIQFIEKNDAWEFDWSSQRP